MPSAEAIGVQALSINEPEAKDATEFTLFSGLPVELRLLIWEKFAEEPRYYLHCLTPQLCATLKRDVLSVVSDRSLVTCRHYMTCPVALRICRESREVSLARYPRVEGGGADLDRFRGFEWYRWYNSEVDITLYRFDAYLLNAHLSPMAKNMAFYIPEGLLPKLRQLDTQATCGSSRVASTRHTQNARHSRVRAGLPGVCAFFLPDSMRDDDARSPTTSFDDTSSAREDDSSKEHGSTDGHASDGPQQNGDEPESPALNGSVDGASSVPLRYYYATHH